MQLVQVNTELNFLCWLYQQNRKYAWAYKSGRFSWRFGAQESMIPGGSNYERLADVDTRILLYTYTK